MHGPTTAAASLDPVLTTMRAVFGTSTRIPEVAPDLVVRDEAGWIAASRLGTDHLPVLMETATRRWNAPPHVAVALAWKAYTYWLTLPAVWGYMVSRRVPLLTGDDVLVRFDEPGPLLTLGLRDGINVAVAAGDPLAVRDDLPGITVVADEGELLRQFRRSLLDQHLTPLLTALRGPARIGSRTLLGSVASGIAAAALLAANAAPGPVTEPIGALLRALDIDDLVELVPGRDGRIDVRRRTCCLAFTLPRPKICRDCCIQQPKE